MSRRIGSVSLLVEDCDRALEFYALKLGFEILENRVVGNDRRRVRLAPASSGGTAIQLVEARGAEERARVGDQAGGGVFLALETDDFWRDYRALESRGIVFEHKPLDEADGISVVFRDLYGHRWELTERRGS